MVMMITISLTYHDYKDSDKGTIMIPAGPRLITVKLHYGDDVDDVDDDYVDHHDYKANDKGSMI